MFGLVTGTVSSRTQPSGSAWKEPPDIRSTPSWAPVGGRPGAAMNGHHTGAWSEVIRHVDTGADAAAHPRSRRITPRRDTGRNRRASRRPPSCGAGTAGRGGGQAGGGPAPPPPLHFRGGGGGRPRGARG